MEIIDRSKYWYVAGVYKITNLINGKIYIGSSNNLYERNARHKRRLKVGTHDNPHLRSAVKIYGIDSFKFEVIEICDVSILIEREQFWIDSTNCCNNEIGYNCKILANTSLGIKLSAQAKENLKKAHNNHETRRRHSEASKEMMKNRTPEQRREASDRMKKLAAEWRANPIISEKMRKNKLKSYFLFCKNGDIYFTDDLKSFCDKNNVSYNKILATSSYYRRMNCKGITPKKSRRAEWIAKYVEEVTITPQMRVIFEEENVA